MPRSLLYRNAILRQAGSSLCVKSLNRFDSSSPQKVVPELLLGKQEGPHKSYRRSAYSVVRGRNAPPGLCINGLSRSAEAHATASVDGDCCCCCSALLYRSEVQLFLTPEQERERDDFVFSLKLAQVEQTLRDMVGETAYVQLVGPALAQARIAGLCEDFSWLSANVGNDSDGDEWVARLLLTLEEEHRVKWLREDGGQQSDRIARVPSFKAMYVLYNIESASLELRQLEAIEDRMRENHLEWDMCDAAVACLFAMRKAELRPFFCHVVRKFLFDSWEVPLDESVANLRYVLGAALLLQAFLLITQEAEGASGYYADPPTYMFEVATELRVFASKLLPSNVSDIVKVIAARCCERALSLTSKFSISANSPVLPGFTLWLMREAPSSVSCYYHFRQMVLRSHSEALILLEKSSFLSPLCADLHVVVDILIPLIDACGQENFCTLVFNEVLTSLEERLRRHAPAFSEDDVQLIAALGYRLFEGQRLRCERTTGPMSQSATFPFDARKNEQLEQLQVIDGSPWSLITFSYGYLKEIVRVLIKDKRSLKHQVKQQMPTTVGVATPSEASDGRNMACLPVRSALNLHDTSRCGGNGSGDIDGGQGGGATECGSVTVVGDASVRRASDHTVGVGCGVAALRPMVPASLRERFVTFVEELVRVLVDSAGAKGGLASRVVSGELYNFVNKYVPLPNIHDEYRRKIFLLVNVVSQQDPSSVAGETDTPKKARGCGDESSLSESADEIPAELRHLVASLPLILSPWASVMILREVLRESSGMNPRYNYVLNAAIDLQLPVSTARSRMATMLNMWRFINSQAGKMTFSEQVAVKRRCAFNIPLSYILSSYWSLLTWLTFFAIVGLNVIGMDLESRYVASRLFREFAPPEDTIAGTAETSTQVEAGYITSLYLDEPRHCLDAVDARPGTTTEGIDHQFISSEGLLSTASSIFRWGKNQRQPMTLIVIRRGTNTCDTERASGDFLLVSEVLRGLADKLPFPFYIPLEQPLTAELIVARAAERIRRISFDNAWFVSRLLFRTFPLGRFRAENGLVSHTCAQANLLRRRVTFLLHVHANVPLPMRLIARLHESVLAESGNLVVVAYEDSLVMGGATPEALHALVEARCVRYIPYKRQSRHVEVPSYNLLTLLVNQCMGVWQSVGVLWLQLVDSFRQCTTVGHVVAVAS
ncbi:hypothetical protein ERJ75_000134100 [Trypanosoma vivax]|uniref:Uncharacterized protein n=1 Tax=Trypanosoma vivax (strain Y486) TaxID=1055687 RepID=G0TT27_TRYVY|nr:hypothetical protein TRVL_02489 [Trypanosoma vivax]KAH8619784.1 hypothetical protein ERJ75_000134100 [Trypanosoma vivax]CCC47108.1 conserved hypothetical protein [Trypanosoma vivax Y486]